jgi:MFS transporter, DHA1 family, multidrug resistance protein
MLCFLEHAYNGGAVMAVMDLERHRNDWRVLLLVFTLAGVVESQAFGHLNAFTPLYLQQLHVPRRQIPEWTGILSALAFVIGIPLLPFWGVWADRFSRKLIIVRSAYLEGLLFTVAALAPNVYVLALARFLAGFVLGNTGVMLALLADVTPRQRLGLAVGLASAGFPLGSSIGPFLGGLIATGPGIRILLLIDAGASASIGILLTFMVHDEPKMRRISQTAGQMLKAAVHDIVYSPVVVRLFLLYFAAMFGYSMATPFVPLRLQQLYLGPAKFLPTTIGFTLTAAGIAMALTTPIWGRLGDRIGRWYTLPVCIGAVGIGIFVEGLAPSILPLQAAIVWVGLFLGGVGTTVVALLALLSAPERRSSILNFSLLPSQLSWFLAPAIGAALASFSIRAPFFVGAAALGGALLLAIMLAAHSRRDPEEAQPLDGKASTSSTSPVISPVKTASL